MPAEPSMPRTSGMGTPRFPRRVLALCSVFLVALAAVLTLAARQGHLSRFVLIAALVCAVAGSLLLGYQVLTDGRPGERSPRARARKRPDVARGARDLPLETPRHRRIRPPG
ncbi:hypothetical protein LY474_25435 [Myxococcus stipitatus]|uniref:hypothetical protein n=1 Tax=Myxococcus stipitatus TaxID=83455 RepID=UPI001F1E628D|nr:hypothetical protein [Myxococcus stipitatus]MCE9671157.1 hypothetical protein [Myxococcus stipitatus]